MRTQRPGILGSAALFVALLACSPAPERGVVLVVIDPLRADRLGAYGNPRPTSPVFDRLAREGVLFEQAISSTSWTLPAMVGLLSGRFPSAAIFPQEQLEGSIVESLQRAGVRTAAFTGAGFASARYGFSRGFDTFEEQRSKVAAPDPGGGDPHEAIVLSFDAALRFLRAIGDEPFFLLVHTYEPHTPYVRGRYLRGLDPGVLGDAFHENLVRIRAGELPLTETERRYVTALYDGGVRASDRQLGRLLRGLERLGLDRSTAVIVTSDHGEHFGERTPRRIATHGHSLHDDLVRVPLVVYDPASGFPARRVATQVSTLDIAPTMLELFGLPVPAALDGRSLLPVLRGQETAHRPVFSHLKREGLEQLSLRDGRFKIVRNLGGSADGPVALYDLASDPEERHDLANTLPEIRAPLERELERFRAELERREPLAPSLEPGALPADLREQLGALGYLDEEGVGAP